MTRPASERTFLTPAEVAEKLRIGLSTVYRAMEDGRLPARKVLGRWRIDDAELSEWINSHSIPEPRPQITPRATPARGRSSFGAKVRAMEERLSS